MFIDCFKKEEGMLPKELYEMTRGLFRDLQDI